MATLEIQEHVALAPFTTMGIGGPARFFAHVRTERELEQAVTFSDQNHLRLAILGGGSNLLVHDDGFPGLVLHLDLRGPVHFESVGAKVKCVAPAGHSWDDFVHEACNLGLSGVECLAGIPGSVGGTPVQNVGAYGQEVSQTVSSVRAYDLWTRSYVEIVAEDCGFSYRRSRFNTNEGRRFLVSSVSYRLQESARSNLTYAELRDRFPGGAPIPIEVYLAVREIRRGKGMLFAKDDPDSQSAGSFFKNPIITAEHFADLHGPSNGSSEIPHWAVPHDPGGTQCVKLAAAWLVEKAGFPKGFALGRAGISSKHALALVNRGGATFMDIIRLRDRIQQSVSEKFNIDLEQEPVELSPVPLNAPVPGQH